MSSCLGWMALRFAAKSASKRPALKRMSGNILTSTGQMLAFVKQFLANASTDRGLVVNPESICLNTLSSKVVRQYAEPARQKGIQLHHQTPGGSTLAQADRAALE